MILSHRVCALEGRVARLETHAVFSESFRVHAVKNAGVISEDRLSTIPFDRKGKVGRPVATVILEGTARLEAFGKTAWIAPGEASVLESKTALLMRQSRRGEPYASLVVEWEPASERERPAGFSVVALGANEVALARRAAEEIARSKEPSDALKSLLQEAFAMLAANGIPVRVPPGSELAEEPEPSSLRLSQGLDEMLSQMGQRPMIVDLHEKLGVSARTANRMVQDFNARYGFNASTWQDTRSRRRVIMSAALLTADGVTATEVAKAMGYGSLPSLTRALTQAGMPSPSEIPRFVRDLLDAKQR